MAGNHVGDDLKAARQFVDDCEACMSGLLSGETVNPENTKSDLSRIQSAAMRINARAIASMAQVALGNCEGYHKRPEQLHGSLLGLNKLVHQYRTGLDEVWVKPLKEGPQISSTTSVPIPEKTDEFQQLIQARRILQPLIKFAANETDKAALTLLAGLEIVQPSEQNVVRSLDVIMPSITNELLRFARQSGKSLSISHGFDEIWVSGEMATALETGLGNIGKYLISKSIDHLEHRQTVGKCGSAHMAFTARGKGELFDFMVTCEGKPVHSTELDLDILQQFGGQLHISYAVSYTHLTLPTTPYV